MKRRAFIALMGASVAWPFAAMAQQAGRTYRLGWLSPFARDASFNIAFFNELRRRGFIEGQNLTIDFHAFTTHLDLISQYAAELKRIPIIRRHSLHA
jgi:putative ABC transport system substrate-binding protein